MSSRRPSLRLARILDRLDRRKRAARKAAAAGAAQVSDQSHDCEPSSEISKDDDEAGRGEK